MPLVPHVAAGQVVASTWGNLVADHVVMRFTTTAQRTSLLTAPIPGQLTTLDTAPGVIEFWSGSAWLPAVGPRELAYAQIVANKTVTATAEAVADLIVAAPAVTLDGATPILIEVNAPAVSTAAAASSLVGLWLYQDGVGIGRVALVGVAAAGGVTVPVYGARRITPAAGSHTYTLGATQAGGTGTVQAGPGTPANLTPAFIRVTRAA